MAGLAPGTHASRLAASVAIALALAIIPAAAAQPGHKITTPKEALGFEIGDDYHLANYTQLSAWWHKLATESDRMKLVEIGQTEEGRPQYMCIITRPKISRSWPITRRSRRSWRTPKVFPTRKRTNWRTKAKP